MLNIDTQNRESRDWSVWLWLLLFAGYGLGALAQQLPWLAAIAGIYLLARDPRRALATPGWGTFLGMLALVLLPASLSLLDTVSWDSSGSTWVRLLSYGFAALAMMQLRLDNRQWRQVQWGVFILLTFFAVDGVAQFFLGFNTIGRPVFYGPEQIPQATGFLRVDYGHVMAIMTPFILETLVKHSRQRPWLWLVFPVFVLAIILSGSRASVALFLVAVVLHGLFLMPHLGVRRLLWFYSIVVVLAFTAFALAMASANTGPRWLSALGVFSSDEQAREVATSFRTIIWSEAWKQFTEHPINGVGLRAFRVASMDSLAAVASLPDKPAGWHAHLILLEVAVCLGLIGVVCFGVLYGWWCRWLWRAPRAALAPGLMVLLAWFPFMSYLSAFSMRICAMLWPMLALAIMLEKQASSAEIHEPQRILIVRLSAIGDVVFSSPLIAALKRRYPQADISWLVEPPAASLLQANSKLSEVIVWDKSAWKTQWQRGEYLKLLKTLLAFRKALRRRRFDMVLDVQGLMKSALLARMTGAKQRIGFVAKEKTGWLLTQRLHKREDTTRICSEYRGFAEDIGLPTETFEMDVALNRDDRQLAANEVHNGPYAVIAPFTTRPQKHWFDDHWFELTERIDREFGLRILMLGGPGDREHAEKLADGSVIKSKVGDLSLRASAALISRASLLIGVDTGLTHMGIAYDIPTVALFGSTCPYRDTGRDNARVIYHGLDCSPCRRRPTCDGRFDCLRLITPDEVMAIARSLPGVSGRR